MSTHTVVERPSMMIMGIECRTSNAPDAAPHDIPRLWGRFAAEGIQYQIPNKASQEIFVLYCDYESDHTQSYSCVIGCPVSAVGDIPGGRVVKVIPAGRYAAYRAIGEHPQTLIETWGAIWQGDLNRAYTVDFELYGDKFSNSPQEVEVFVALQ